MSQERLREQAIVALVRRRLEADGGKALPEERVLLGRTSDGAERRHRFDLAAADRSLIGEVRTYTLGEGNSRPSGKFAHCYAACLFLFRARAKRKVLVLTDRAFWSRFRRESDGLVEGIEIIHVPVDDALPIVTDEPTLSATAPGPYRGPGAGPRPPRPDAPPPRRNRGGPGPRGRRPNAGGGRGER